MSRIKPQKPTMLSDLYGPKTLERIALSTKVFTQYAMTGATTISNTSTETTLITSGKGSLILPADSLRVGNTFKFTGHGAIWTKTAPVGNLTLRLKIGSSTVLTLTHSSLTASLAGVLWTLIDASVTVTTIGSSGNVSAEGLTQFNSTLIPFTVNGLFPVSLDTSVANTIDLTAQWATASSSNILTMSLLTIARYG